jgi:outer membrane protein TolC
MMKRNFNQMKGSAISGGLCAVILLLGCRAWAEETGAPQGHPVVNSTAHEISLEKVLKAAEEMNPGIQVAQSMEEKAEALASIVSSGDYPSLSLAGADSLGLPANYYPTPWVYDGLLNSPTRRWGGVDLVGRWSLLDVSRWNDLEHHHQKTHAAEEQVRIKRLELYQQALQYYLEASLFRGQREVWGDIAAKGREFLQVAKSFVRTGQYNEDKMLNIRIQMEEAETERDSFEEQYRKTLRKMALLTGLDDKAMECPLPSSLDEGILKAIQGGSVSPYLSFAQVEIKSAKSAYDKYWAERLPTVFAEGTIGAFEGSNFAPQNDYSVWVGINLPLFDGYRIGSEEREGKAEIREKEKKLEDAQLDVDELNVQYDEKISVARIRIPLLEKEHEDAIKSFRMARQRFLAYKESVTIVRESLRDLANIGVQLNQAEIDLLNGLGLKTFLNGGTVPK